MYTAYSQYTQIVSTVVDTIITSHMRYVSYSQYTQIVSTVVDTITTSHMRYVSYFQYTQIVSTVVDTITTSHMRYVSYSYSLFQLSRPRFLSGSSRKHSQHIFFMLVGAPICVAQFRIEHVFYREFAAREKSLFIHWNHRVPPCQGEESESIAPRRTSSSTCTGFLRRKVRRPRTRRRRD